MVWLHVSSRMTEFHQVQQKTKNKAITKQVFIKMKRWGFLQRCSFLHFFPSLFKMAYFVILSQFRQIHKAKTNKEKVCHVKYMAKLNTQKSVLHFSHIHFQLLTIQKVCSHEQFQRDLWSDREFGYFCGAVGVADLVGEIHAHLGQDVRRYLPEVHFIGFILSKLSCK